MQLPEWAFSIDSIVEDVMQLVVDGHNETHLGAPCGQE